ncbi:MarR family winged helix-turn-helix transcriptional regulator [Candidatus Latescibacterota bacterium]
MSLAHELGLKKSFEQKDHEGVLNIIFTGILLSKEGQRIFRPFGITEAYFNILMLLKFQSSEGRINQTILGDMLFVKKSNITGLIDRMEKAGLVTRIPDPFDRRVNFVEITSAGSEIFEKASKVYYERIAEIMYSFSKSDFNDLFRLLESVRERLNTNGK